MNIFELLNKDEKGITLIEVMIALIIFSISVIALGTLSVNSLKLFRSTTVREEVFMSIESAVEDVRRGVMTRGRTQTSDMIENDVQNRFRQGLREIDPNATIQVDIRETDERDMIPIVVRVNWSTANGIVGGNQLVVRTVVWNFHQTEFVD